MVSPRCPPWDTTSCNIRCSWIAHGAPLDWALDGLPATCGEDEASALSWSHLVLHFAGKKVENPGRAPFRKARKSTVQMKKKPPKHIFSEEVVRYPEDVLLQQMTKRVFSQVPWIIAIQCAKAQLSTTGELDAFCEATGHDFSHWGTPHTQVFARQISARSSSVSG